MTDNIRIAIVLALTGGFAYGIYTVNAAIQADNAAREETLNYDLAAELEALKHPEPEPIRVVIVEAK